MADEIEYEQLLADEKKIKIKVKEKRRTVGKAFKKEHKWMIRTLDIIFILMILSNCGALIITNALVFKVTPTVTLLEANPVAAETHGFETHDNNKQLFSGIMLHMFAWGLFLVYFLYSRYYVYSMTSYWSLMFFVVVAFTVLFLDFVNDFGYWIGKMVWGG